MAFRTPAQIRAFLDANMHRMDGPSQYLGDEPNSCQRPFDGAAVTSLIAASWVYNAAAGNQSIPAVYASINAAPGLMCDRYYLPSTPRDLAAFERAGYPVFGIESKHQLVDFDVVMTSISYPVLVMSFYKMLSMSDVPPRRSVREQAPEKYPFILVGGQIYGDPECLAPIIDCMWLGECEDEPGNPGIQAVFLRIADLKAAGLWATARRDCYARLAREFNFLYFPTFVDVQYGYEDRSHVGVGVDEQRDADTAVVLSKQVIGYRSNLPGMRMPFLKRIVKDLDAIPPLAAPPLLYTDVGMGAGDLEVGRGCPAWCVGYSEYIFQPGEGVVKVGDLARRGHSHDPLQLTSRGEPKDVSCVVPKGLKPTIRIRTEQGHYIECTPDHQLEMHTVRSGKLSRGRRVWRKAGDLQIGDILPIHYGQSAFGPSQEMEFSGLKMTSGLAWLIGFLVGDGGIHADRFGDPCAFGFGVWAGSEVEQEVRRLCRDELGFDKMNEQPVGDGKINWMRIQRKPLITALCRDLGFAPGRATDDSKHHIPEVIMRSPEVVQRAFLLGLFEADGNVDAEGKYVRLVTVSERLAREVSLLLLNLGQYATWHRKDVPVDRGLVQGGRGYAFHVNVRRAIDTDREWWRFVLPAKDERLEVFRASLEVDQAAANVNYLQSRRGPIMSRVVAIEDAGIQEVADFTLPDGESFDCSGMVAHNCSFCALTYRQKPYRQRSVEYMTEFGKQIRDNMGASRLAPFMPDFPMHSQRKKLVKSLLENVSDEVDAPAMRVDDFIADEDYILLQVHGGLDDVTLGLEGNSQRMRDLVGKGASDQMVRDAVSKGIRAGIRKFKLFMISDLPGEDDGDIFRIARLARELADIREQSGQPNIRIQFSWTPLLIEANTPFQWFAPTPKNSKALMDVWEEFRDLKIEFKMGSKADPNKMAFFQLCQRASREVGEAILDWLEEADKACWGGVPRTTEARLTHYLIQHGFHNGFGDCFDEREKVDMFGWEFIDQGVSSELLWATYTQMREFAENTDSSSYDAHFDDTYLGAEFIARCDSACLGRSCGVCDVADLKIRKGYIAAGRAEIEVDLSQVNPIDQASVAFKVRAKISKPVGHRFVMNDHWRFAVRRAAFRAQTALGTPYGIAKRTIAFASDEVQAKDWTSGVDYVEFGMTRRISPAQLAEFIAEMGRQLINPATGTPWIKIGSYDTVAAEAKSIRRDVERTLYELALEDDPATVAAAIAAWQLTPYVRLTLRSATAFFGTGVEEVNAKEYVDAFWLVRSGAAVTLKMIAWGRPTPYELSAALLSKRSWIEAAAAPAMRLESFVHRPPGQADFFRPDCVACGQGIPITLLDVPYHPDYCPACLDREQGRTLEVV